MIHTGKYGGFRRDLAQASCGRACTRAVTTEKFVCECTRARTIISLTDNILLQYETVFFLCLSGPISEVSWPHYVVLEFPSEVLEFPSVVLEFSSVVLEFSSVVLEFPSGVLEI